MDDDRNVVTFSVVKQPHSEQAINVNPDDVNQI